MTPDDMEGLSANLLADLGVLAATAREVPFDVWDRFANNVQQAAALLLDYQERGRALRFYADEHEYPSDGPWGVNSDDFGKVARATLKGKSHD
jgi:hypothetical protein